MPDHLRYAVPVHPDDAEVMAARLWAAGALGVWEQPGELVAWYASRTTEVPPGGMWSPEPDRDWQAEWKATIEPVVAGGFTVVPTWRIADHTARPGETIVVLDPGRAFGSGHHATTTLCLEALDALDLEGRRVADVGCGSGVLAIAAAARGARVAGTDLDPDAVEVTAANADRNDVDVRAAVGSVAAAVELLGGPADVVVANLVTDTIVALARELVEACDPEQGILLVSGIAHERQQVAADALRAAGCTIDEVARRAGWVALRGHPTRGRDAQLAPEVTGR